MQIIDNLLPENQYYKEICDKTQIVLHHTVSNPISVKGDKDYWRSDISKIATYAIIDYNGIVNRMFPSDMWAHHLGVKAINLKALNFKDYSTRNILLNQNSIGIEIDNWGGLVKKEGLYYNCYGTPISKDLEVVECHWRGYKYYQKYSDAQINTLKELLPIFVKRYNISTYGLKDGNFELRRDCLEGKSGIYSHSNYRNDKSDLYPDTRIVELLKDL